VLPSSSQNHLAGIRHIIAVAAGKGGVGKSTTALNLAIYFSNQGAKVGLMDADLYGPSLRKMLPEDVPPAQNPDMKERIIPAVCRGIKLISMAYFLDDANPASVRAPIANGIIKQFIHCVDWGDLDYLIIDFPPGTGDIQLTVIQESALSGAVLVTTPQEIALLDVAKTVEMFQQMQVSLIGLVENMSYLMAGQEIHYPFGRGGGERFAQEKGLYFLGCIPISPEISRCCDRGESLFAVENSAAKSFASVAEKVRQQVEAFEKLEENRLKNFDLRK
jgi:ATP-binding protein involved in chromosome partitioning